MKIAPLGIAGAWQVHPVQHPDDRGVFLEWLRQDLLAEHIGHPLDVRQANCSTSRRGALRGVHFAEIPPGQAKYVTCVKGTVFDVVVDVRVGSPTYGAWEGILLDDVDRAAVYLAEGLGHGFMALSDDATVAYLCSAPYAPGREHGVHPLDPEVGIDWPLVGSDGAGLEPILSPKDASLPSLREAETAGLLPTIGQAQAFYAELDGT